MEQKNSFLQPRYNFSAYNKEKNNSISKNLKNISGINDLKHKDSYISRSSKISDLRNLTKIPKCSKHFQNDLNSNLKKFCRQIDSPNKSNFQVNNNILTQNMFQNNGEKQLNNISKINLDILNLIKKQDSHYIKRENGNYIITPNILLDNYKKFKFKKIHNKFNKNKSYKESVEWILLHSKKEKKHSNTNEIFSKTSETKDQKQIIIPEIIINKNNYKKPNSEREKTPKKKQEDKKINIKQFFLKTQNKKNKDVSFSDRTSKKAISDRNINLRKDSSKKIINKKLFAFDVLSAAGRDNGKEKINQDCFMIVPSINECKNVKIFGVFDGHGDYGEILSKEIKEYIKELFFCNKNLNDLNCDNNKIDEKNIINNIENKNKIFSKTKKRKNKTISVYKFKKRTSKKQFNLNIKNDKYLILNRMRTISKNFINDNIAEKSNDLLITSLYNKLVKNNYLEIYHNFQLIDNKLHNKYHKNYICHGNGVTLSLVFLFNFNNSLNKLITVNLGDTKSILITDNKQIKELTTLHTPSLATERTRIENLGGIISRIDCSIIGPLRVWGADRKTPGLSITRSFGDFDAESLGVISIPDINEFDINEEKIKIVVIGTNGVWEFLTNEKIMDIVLPYYENNDCSGAVKKIKEVAWKMWGIKNPKNIPDVTVIVLFFN